MSTPYKPEGPGKFDKECEQLLMLNSADAVMVAVLGGPKGSGFSIAVTKWNKAPVMQALPGVLRSIADQIESDNKSRN